MPKMDGTAAYDHLCLACKAIFSDDALNRLSEESLTTEWRIHSTVASMVASESDGCRLCNLVISSSQRLRALADSMKDNSFATATSNIPNEYCKCRLAPHPRGVNSFCGKLEIYVPCLTATLTWCIFSVNAQVAGNITGRRRASQGSIAESTLQQIGAWMSSCLKHHDLCRKSWTLVASHKRLPTRLLDVSNLDRIRVVYTDQLPTSTTYFTLSHRWGSRSFISLRTETYDALFKSIPLASMPRTFREAIELTRLLGAQYLWIDSLCIIQDSCDDWLHESSMMGEVYAHGALNIASTAAKDGEGGIFGGAIAKDRWLPRLFSSRLWTTVDQDDENIRDYIIYPEHDAEYPEVWMDVVEETPLGRRGWVLQERILSPRVVHFASNQCFWECCQDTAGELYPKDIFRQDGFLKQITISVSPGHEMFDQSQAVLYAYWDATVEKYSRCDLTVESDKLIAFAGLAQRACRQMLLKPSDYMAGLWRPKIEHGLLWRVAQYDPRRRPVLGRGPSWSWSSREGTVRTFSEEAQLWDSEECNISILDYEMYHDGNPFGRVTGGKLKLRGCLWNNVYELLGRPGQRQLDREDQFPQWYKDDDEKYPSSYFLLVFTHQNKNGRTVISGLVLVPTEINRGQFRRVGVILNHEILCPETFMKTCKDPQLLDSSLYLHTDPEHGFTIEIL